QLAGVLGRVPGDADLDDPLRVQAQLVGDTRYNVVDLGVDALTQRAEVDAVAELVDRDAHRSTGAGRVEAILDVAGECARVPVPVARPVLGELDPIADRHRVNAGLGGGGDDRHIRVGEPLQPSQDPLGVLLRLLDRPDKVHLDRQFAGDAPVLLDELGLDCPDRPRPCEPGPQRDRGGGGGGTAGRQCGGQVEVCPTDRTGQQVAVVVEQPQCLFPVAAGLSVDRADRDPRSPLGATGAQPLTGQTPAGGALPGEPSAAGGEQRAGTGAGVDDGLEVGAVGDRPDIGPGETGPQPLRVG